MSRVNYDDADEMFSALGSDLEPIPQRPPLQVVKETPAAEELPSADEMNREQTIDAIHRLHEDTSDFPRFPWGELDEIAGLMVPEDLWVVAGRTGNGKSLFLQNLFDGMIDDGRRVLYVGLEQSPKILRIKWACLRAGINPKRMLAPKPEEQAETSWAVQCDVIQQEIKWQQTPDIKLRAHFAATRFVTREKLTAWTEWAVDMGCAIVIVDHVDRMDHGDGKNAFNDISRTIRHAKELATEHRLVMLLASQVGRPNGDPLQKFMPPGLSDLRGAGTKEEEADSVLAVYRPLKPGTTPKEMTAVRQGLAEEASIYEPDTMAVRVLKHRLDGAMALGKQAMLQVDRGKIKSRPIRDFGKYDV